MDRSSGVGTWRAAGRLGMVALVVVGGCGCQEAAPPPDAPATAAPSAATGSGSDTEAAAGEGVLRSPERADNAFTYNLALAPEGADIAAYAEPHGPATTVQLTVEGLLPNRGYAAHAHANPCGPTGDAAGPHFQNDVDPAAGPGKPSTNPAYANLQNEIWLDLRTDGDGGGRSTADVPFAFTGRAPASIVLHEAQVTSTEPGKAGTAGARLACLDVAFG